MAASLRSRAMRAVVQRVSEAGVSVEGEEVGRIGPGFLVLLGVSESDAEEEIDYLADKIVNLRVFEDGEGKLNLSLLDVGGQMLVVSQFTLHGDCRKGRRPSFSHAAAPAKAEDFYLRFIDKVRERGIKVESGRFRAMMDVRLVNRGPVTLLLDGARTF